MTVDKDEKILEVLWVECSSPNMPEMAAVKKEPAGDMSDA
jgi:hypothetical protein